MTQKAAGEGAAMARNSSFSSLRSPPISSPRYDHHGFGSILEFSVMRSMVRGFAWLSVAFFVLLLARGARASDAFDPVMRMELGLPSGPLLCMTCHASLIGGPGTVVKPFGLKARELGLEKGDLPKLKEVLQQMEASNVDSDCDGVGDIAELRARTDPNAAPVDAGDVQCADVTEPPRFGFYCSTSAATRRNAPARSVPLASAGVLTILLLARRSRRIARSLPS
jgi:hypothetical protein